LSTFNDHNWRRCWTQVIGWSSLVLMKPRRVLSFKRVDIELARRAQAGLVTAGQG
jgi:hypothetical protein